MKSGWFCDLRVFLVRHGQAHSNQHHAFLGRQDEPLTEKGLFQAAHVSDMLQPYSIDAIYASPLKRARTTADIIANVQGLEVVEEARLIEQDFGAWDGLPITEVANRFADDFVAWRRGDDGSRPTDGETMATVGARVAQFGKELREQYRDGKNVVLVAHAGSLQALLCQWLNVPLRNIWPFRLQLASITEVNFSDGLASLTRLSWQ